MARRRTADEPPPFLSAHRAKTGAFARQEAPEPTLNPDLVASCTYRELVAALTTLRGRKRDERPIVGG